MKILALITALCLAFGAILGGSAPFGRVLLALGLPQFAINTFEDPEWRSVALFKSGNYAEAARVLRGQNAHYNLGTAQAFAGNYAASLEAFDIAIVAGDEDAAANFDIVAAHYASLGVDAEALALFNKREDGPTEESFIARGNARAAGSGSDVTNANTMLGLAELDSRGRLGVRRIFDDKFMIADERWLVQLEDVPGAYLKERIKQEYKRRVKAGLAPPDPEVTQ